MEPSADDLADIQQGRALQLVETWRGRFIGGRLIRAGKHLSCPPCYACVRGLLERRAHELGLH